MVLYAAQHLFNQHSRVIPQSVQDGSNAIIEIKIVWGDS